MTPILVFLAVAAGADASRLTRASAKGAYILADRGESCCPGAEISGPDECLSAYEELNAALNFPHPNVRGIAQIASVWPGVPAGCSLQYECGRWSGMWDEYGGSGVWHVDWNLPCFVTVYNDMTPHWSGGGGVYTDNSRTPEFRSICKATPDCNIGASCAGEYVLEDDGVLCSAGEELANQKECLSAYEQLNATHHFPYPNVRTIHTNPAGWPDGVPVGCSLQHSGSYVHDWRDQTPHWTPTSVNSSNARIPEFRAICCKSPPSTTPIAPTTVAPTSGPPAAGAGTGGSLTTGAPTGGSPTTGALTGGSPTTPGPAGGCAIKDGFLPTTCVKDYLYYHGDQFGDNRYEYELGPVSNVSIVHYESGVAKEDRHAMTPEVCFKYCRTLPNMGFFGIVNGRNCYCSPYFQQMASDSSRCDSVCDGNPGLICGGKSKSSIFAMHCCASAKAELQTKIAAAASLKAGLDNDAEAAESLSHGLQDSGDALQKSFGAVGDGGAASHAQAAKVFAGKLVHTAESAAKISTKLATLIGKASALLPGDFQDVEYVREAEGLLKTFGATIAEGGAASDELSKILAWAEPHPHNVHVNASKQYYPVMYFVAKEFADVPSTCAGDMLGEPMQADEDTCAAMCDNNFHTCVGYQWFGHPPLFDKGKCVLLSKLKAAVYYTGCGTSQDEVSVKFLQKYKRTGVPFEARCVVKFSKFQGTTLKPDGSGKCKRCLRKVTKATRCY